jgi:hypothetical protein
MAGAAQDRHRRSNEPEHDRGDARRDIHGPQMTAPAKKAAKPTHSGVARPSGTIASPQPITIPVMIGHIAAALIPSPSAEAAAPGRTWRSTG